MTKEYIGKGSYGIVTSTGNHVTKTCKIFTYDDTNDFYLDDHSVKEAIFYQLVNKSRKMGNTDFNECIPNVTVTIQHNHSLLFEMDFLGQPLSKFRFTNRQQTIHIFKQILLGLYSIHSKGFTHGDLKPDNILLNEHNKVTLIDYGSICFWHHTSIYPQSYQRCTLYYVSPEEISGKGYSDKNDIWSFGVILFEWCSGHSFVLTLLKEIGVSKKEQDLFTDYTSQGKEDSVFHPTLFLAQLYEGLSYSQLFEFIKKHIKDRDLLKVIGHCLLKDTNIRCSASRLLESNVFNTECPNRPHSSSQEITFKPLIDTLRTDMQNYIWWVCNNISKFSPSLFGHSVTLFDRVLLRANHQNVYIEPLSLAICCTVLSNMILKGHLLRASTIVDIHTKCKKKEWKSVTIDDIKYYFGLIFSVSQFFLYNKSIDMVIMEHGLSIDYDKLRKLCQTYILTTESTSFLLHEYKKEI